MSVLQAILLGIVQGITEFLPVSSFGHMAAIENAMDITRDTAVLFEVLLHVGTLVCGAFWCFREDIRKDSGRTFGNGSDLIGNANIYFHNRGTGTTCIMPESFMAHTENLQLLCWYLLFPQLCWDTSADVW